MDDEQTTPPADVDKRLRELETMVDRLCVRLTSELGPQGRTTESINHARLTLERIESYLSGGPTVRGVLTRIELLETAGRRHAKVEMATVAAVVVCVVQAVFSAI